jgi:hypothetical protein
MATSEMPVIQECYEVKNSVIHGLIIVVESGFLLTGLLKREASGPKAK